MLRAASKLARPKKHYSDLIMDGFAGAGGASFGIEQAVLRPVDIAINHDRLAIDCHQANHPDTWHLCESIYAVDPMEATDGKPVWFAWFSPDCFPAGTMVLTQQGYKSIETVEVGELVFTHQKRWRPVTHVFKTKKRMRTLVGYGHYGLRVSDEHPFWVRRRSTTHVRANAKQKKKSELRHHYSQADWVRAGEISKGCYWATPTEFPHLPIPEVGGRGLPLDTRLFTLAGMYVGNGWSRLNATHREVVITCGKHRVAEFREKLNQWPASGPRSLSGEIRWQERETDTAYQFTCNHKGLVLWLRNNFGHLAPHKKVPGWLLGAREDFRSAFLSGYLSCDGYDGGSYRSASSVSKALLLGINAVASSLGRSTSFYKGRIVDSIQGRKVNAKQPYLSRWQDQVAATHVRTLKEGGFEWKPISETIPAGSKLETAYNLSVADDESYVVEGVITHNCTHFSLARGGKPRQKNIRSLAWVVCAWARSVRPAVIFVENVREFETWGPLTSEGYINPHKKGTTFKRWVSSLRKLGYAVEWRLLSAADYGVPTLRKRLFIIARCDGNPIVWPEPTHGPGREHPWRTAAECIDWSIPCPSVFLTKAECRKYGIRANRPLAENTLRRVAKGTVRYVIENSKPYILQYHGDQDGSPILEPLPTVTANGRSSSKTRPGGAAPLGLVMPYGVKVNHADGTPRDQNLEQPLDTVTSINGFGVAQPYLVPRFSEREGQEARSHSLDQPLPTATSRGGGGFNLVAPAIASIGQTGGGDRTSSVEDPVRTIVSKAENCLVSAALVQHFTGRDGVDIEKPLPTVTAADHHSLLSVSTVRHYGKGWSRSVDEPVPTITSNPHESILAASMVDLYGSAKSGRPVDAPCSSVSAQGNHQHLVASHMIINAHGEKKWAGVDEPLRTVLAGGRHHAVVSSHLTHWEIGPRARKIPKFLKKYADYATEGPVVQVPIGSETYTLTDLGMRMLRSSELALAQGFPPEYILEGPEHVKVSMIGNSVCPKLAEVLVRANVFSVKGKKRRRFVHAGGLF